MNRTSTSPSYVRSLAVAAAIGFLGIAAFELALALGAPLGRAAWGGDSAHLSTGLRVASAIAVAVWVLASLIVLGRGGMRIVRLSDAFERRGTWILFGLLALATVVNFASPSVWERYTWGPISLMLAVLCFLLARSGTARPTV